jgi:hypothetical protein
VLVRQRIVDSVNLRNSSQDLVAHLVHCRLYTGAVVFSEDLHCNVPRSRPCSIEVDRLRLVRILEQLPLPASLDICAENPVPGLRELGVLIAVEAVESRSSALQHEQLLDLGADGNALALASNRLDNAELISITVERVRVRLSINVHAGPSVLDDLDVCRVDMRVGRDEVITDDGGELLGGINRVLLSKDVRGLLLGVGSNDD